jgi:NCS1 family nucleobase:cation symporter-1
VGGVILCDYVFVRRFRVDVEALYTEGSEYAYGSGFNQAALAATLAGIGVAFLGLASPSLRFLFDGAWFSATAAAGLVYWWLMRDTARTLGKLEGAR